MNQIWVHRNSTLSTTILLICWRRVSAKIVQHLNKIVSQFKHNVSELGMQWLTRQSV